MEKKIIVRRILSLSGALFFLLFGANLGSGRFCLGDWILTAASLILASILLMTALNFLLNLL